MLDDATEAIVPLNRKSKSYLGLSMSRLMRKKVAVVCMTVIAVMYGSGIFSPLVAPYGYNDQDLSQVKQRPSWSHPFGTDRLGHGHAGRQPHIGDNIRSDGRLFR